jgi:hypothetical protein
MMEYTSDIREDFAKKKAAEYGCTIEYADEFTLQLDLDSPQAFTKFQDMYKLAKELKLFEHDEGYLVRTSKSGYGKHVTIALTESLSTERRIALQAMLGSDSRREMLSLARLDEGQERPILLFRPIPGHKPQPVASLEDLF